MQARAADANNGNAAERANSRLLCRCL